MSYEPGNNNPFAAELEADFVSSGSLSRVDETAAASGKVLIPLLQQLEPGNTLYLTSDDGEALNAYDSAHITKIDGLHKTRKNAYSGIFFGQLSLTGPSGEENTQMVAVKPLGREWLAAQEYAVARTINMVAPQAASASRRMTFDPVAFHRLPDGRISVLTTYEQRVKSFDNTLWVPPESRPDERAVRWALGNAAASLIFLHGNALVHSDYQVKNTAVDPNGPRIIDITGTKKVGGIGSTAADAYVDDLREYIASLNVIAYEHDAGPYVTEAQARQYFVAPYAGSTAIMFGQRNGLKDMIDYRLSAASLTDRL